MQSPWITVFSIMEANTEFSGDGYTAFAEPFRQIAVTSPIRLGTKGDQSWGSERRRAYGPLLPGRSRPGVYKASPVRRACAARCYCSSHRPVGGRGQRQATRWRKRE